MVTALNALLCLWLRRNKTIEIKKRDYVYFPPMQICICLCKRFLLNWFCHFQKLSHSLTDLFTTSKVQTSHPNEHSSHLELFGLPRSLWCISFKLLLCLWSIFSATWVTSNTKRALLTHSAQLSSKQLHFKGHRIWH